jgi:type I restriction enzyme S subunit
MAKQLNIFSEKAGTEADTGRRWKRYPAYKDSDIEWLGKIPEHWLSAHLRYFVRVRSGDAPPEDRSPNDDVPVYGANGVIGYCSRPNSERSRVSIGRVGAVGEVHQTPPRVWISDNALIVDPNPGELLPAYLASLLRTLDLASEANRNAQPLITATQVKARQALIPPIHEQRAIAAFLDRETARIDALIEKKHQQIELLQEKRTALVSHAVTKGLDPTVPVRDSGIEWLARIPEHWLSAGLRHFVRVRSGEAPPEDKSTTGEVPIYGANGLRGYAHAYTHEGEHVLIGRQGALCGCINYAKGRFWASEHAVVVTPTGGTDVTWLGELLRSMNLNRYSQSAAQPGLAVETLVALFLPVPPVSEQQVLSDSLHRETARIGALVTKVEESIGTLREYRTALISAAVTGKIDVRGEVAS